MKLAALMLGAWTAAATGSAPHLRVETGRAQVVVRREARTLTPENGDVRLPERATLEAAAGSALELRWPGFASLQVTGPALFEVDGSRLVLGSLESAEIEVRRGRFALEFPGVFRADLEGGALQLVALPNGGVELLNRSGGELEIRPQGRGTTTLAPGQRLRLRPAG